MNETNHSSDVGEALEVLIAGLRPFVDRVLAEAVPNVDDWALIIEHKDRSAGRRVGTYSRRDLSLMLRAMTEHLGEIGYPFENSLSRRGKLYASELRQVRNDWAHNQEFSAAQAYRAMDSMELLLRLIAADEEAAKISTLKSSLAPIQTPARNEPIAGDEPAHAPRHQMPASDGDQLAPAAAVYPSAASIETNAITFLSYAMAMTQIPVLDEITISHVLDDRRGASIQIEVVSATGSLGDPKVQFVDLEAGQSTTLRDIGLQLDPQRMLEVDVEQHGELRVALRSASGDLLAQSSIEVRVLAANQWVAAPLQLGLELLAVHVQPNSSALTPLLVEASDLLGAATGRTALDGYQSESPERVDAMVAAIYDAIRQRDIRYSEPPATWGQRGQRVRTPREVLDERLGTCLDTTITMASALEQAGINSTLWLASGHIFLGYWRSDRSIGTVATTDAMELANLVDLGHIGLIETTFLTGGADSRPFGEANRAPRSRYLRPDSERDALLGVTDIREAREHRIFPLPSRTIANDGTIVISTYEAPRQANAEPYFAPAGGAGSAVGAPAIPRRVQLWKNALLDLSLRNKLINYTDRAGYRLEVPPSAIARLEDAINAGHAIALNSSDDIPTVDKARGVRWAKDLPESNREESLATKRRAYIDITGASYTSKLRYLAYKAKTVVEESGANNLYLAFGMLHWKLNDRELRSPLVLVPVNLTTANRGQEYRLTLDEAGASTPNYCLLEKLRVSFGLEIDGLANPIEDDSGIDLPAAFHAARTAIATAGLPFRVEESADLSILQFAKFRLWKDLDENWEVLAENALVSHLIQTPLDPFTDPAASPGDFDLDELGEAVPVPADASQLGAVAEAVAGRTFVLEGPPGTGKSQTITNLLARALAAGKRVLFVAEKRAALDVVKSRLEMVGLGDLSLDLHDKSARPAAVRSQIKRALDLAIRADSAKLKADVESAQASRRALARYAERLHEPNAAGLSLYSARTTGLALDRDVPALDVPTSVVGGSDMGTLESLRASLRQLPETADLARPGRNHPWGFVDEASGKRIDVSQLLAAATAFDSALAGVIESGIPLAHISLEKSPDGLTTWTHISRAPRHPLTTLDALTDPAWTAYLSSLRGEIMAFPKPGWISQVRATVLTRDVRDIHREAIAADTSGFFGRKKRRRAVLARFADELEVEVKTIRLKALSTLTAEMEATATSVEALRERLSAVPIPLSDTSFNPLIESDVVGIRSRIEWIEWLCGALRNRADPAVAAVRTYFAGTPSGTSAGELETFQKAWQDLQDVAGTRSAAAAEWVGTSDFLTKWWLTRSDRRLNEIGEVGIVRWLEFTRALEPLRTAGLESARRALLVGEVPAEYAAIALDRGIAEASMLERQDAAALAGFDLEAHTRTIHRFTQSTRNVRAELPRAIPAELLARRRVSVSAGGKMGALRRQLDRQRGGMSVRALLENYGDLVVEVMPCTLMSPESVARFFPARADLFDIVVFDEASQIRVADAVGAMGRGSSVVVVGDSKQMPPTTFADAGASIDEEADYTPETIVDEESILSESVQAQVPRKWLSWHYRSQDESLIAFSNHHYYENRLSSFPAPMPTAADEGIHGHGITFVRVNGHFERSGRGKSLRTNRVEAEAIVDEVRRRFAASPDATPSLGIITFNAQQRDLVDNLLRDTGDERILVALDARDGVFVKNLENVQGDERDAILFSVAFSVNEKGVLPLNFGPLSRAGGERRLNVAITRARRQVVLFASFDPEQLRAEQTGSMGIKHLKAYLELAARGVEAVTDEARRTPRIDRHRDEIAAELRLAGYAVLTDVGLSEFRVDMSIADADAPDQPLVAVLLDGENWRARQTVADRDGLPVEVLKGLMRWPGVERVWLPEWLHDREGAMRRLAEAVENAKRELERVHLNMVEMDSTASTTGESIDEHLDETPVVRSGSPDSVPELVQASPLGSVTPDSVPVGAARHPDVSDFTAWASARRGSVDVLDALPGRADSVAQVRDAIRAIVESEGPVHRTRVAKLVAAAFGLDRVAQVRAAAILRCVPSELVRAGSEQAFLWPEQIDPDEWLGVQSVSPGSSREVEHISLVEISNAMRVAADYSGGMKDDDVKREALGMFGGKRLTATINERLDAGLELGIASGRLERDSTGYIVNGLRVS
ncbi:DUF3320 domain-containing protein [Agromyces atrinae]|uniref:DUF3320 domain-containing protein n=1 Tax=Agromyces atrinae TaxID=592376 RepID=UPI001F59F32B|nr:DUF3320 domain-containing protein [Agromyces atrinae]MCI2956760.1 DUF3320 domain-containing protein [Agromyces atrinae]